MSDIPAYVDMGRLRQELGGVCAATIRRWMKKGFPRPVRNGLWKWTEVEAYMDGGKAKRLPSVSRDQVEDIQNAHAKFAQERRAG